jgi:hypothetical protein
MLMLTNLGKYDWATWLVGIWRAIITGGTGGVISGFASMGIDPEHFNLTTGLGHVFRLAGIMFVAMAFVHLVLFLNTHPAPDPATAKP